MTGYAVKTINLSGHAVSVWIPRTYRGGYGVILTHGAGAPFEFTDLTAQAASVRLAAAIASAGIPCIAGPFQVAGVNSWGNDVAMAQMTDSRNELPNHVPGLNTDKILLLGVSMGGGAVARYSILNPTEVAGVVGIIPAFDYVYEWENIASIRASMGAAWGVTYPTPLPVGADNVSNAAAAAGIPLLAGYGTADTTVPPTGVLNYVDAVGGDAQIISTTLNHSDALVAAMPISDVIKFLVLNGGT